MADSDNTKKESPSALGKFSASIEQILKIATALIALTYLFGVVVLNIHLGRYGYHSLGLLQLDYIAAGFWSLAPIALAGLLIFIIFYVFASPYIFNEPNKDKKSDWNDKFISLLSAVIGWGLIAYFTFWQLEVDFDWTWLLAGPVGFLIAFGLVFLSFALLSEGVMEEKNRALAITLLIWCIVGLPFYLIFFGRYVYQTIPDVWGGGKATEVTLIAKDKDSRTQIESSGVQFADNEKTLPVKLIWGTDKEIIIVLDDPQIRGVRIEKSLIAGMIYRK